VSSVDTPRGRAALAGIAALIAVVAIAIASTGARVPQPSPTPSAVAVATVPPSQSISKAPPPTPTSNVNCGSLISYTAPSATGGGSVTIDRPASRRQQGGQATYGIPVGAQIVTPSGWTCVRFIPAVPAAQFVSFVATGADGYLAQPSPTPRGEYANSALLYYLTLPEPYRVSSLLRISNSGASVAAGDLPATAEVFTARTVADEGALAAQRCETACAIGNYVAVVEMFTDRQAPRDWYAKRVGAAGETIQDLTIDGRAAIRVTGGGTYPVQIIIDDHTWMLRVAYTLSPDIGPAPPGASKEKLEQILASFHFTQ